MSILCDDSVTFQLLQVRDSSDRAESVSIVLPRRGLNRTLTMEAMAETQTGACYCGAVEIEMRGDPLEVGYCHCGNCRRYSAAPVSAFTLWKKENVMPE